MAGSVGQADFVMPKYSLEAVATIPRSNRSGFQEGSLWGAWRHNDQHHWAGGDDFPFETGPAAGSSACFCSPLPLLGNCDIASSQRVSTND